MLGRCRRAADHAELAGTTPTGLLRAVTSLGGLPAAVVVPAIALHFYPLASRRIAAGEDTTDAVKESVTNLAGKASLGAVALAVDRAARAVVAYSGSFVGAAAALAVMACAGAVRAVGLHGAYLLLASGRRKIYLAAEACAAGVLLVVTIAAGMAASVVGAALAVWVSSAAYLAFVKAALAKPNNGGVRLHLPIPLKLWALQLVAIAVAVGWACFGQRGIEVTTMRILVPLLDFGASGGYRVLAELANRWHASGVDCAFVVPLVRTGCALSDERAAIYVDALGRRSPGSHEASVEFAAW